MESHRCSRGYLLPSNTLYPGGPGVHTAGPGRCTGQAGCVTVAGLLVLPTLSLQPQPQAAPTKNAGMGAGPFAGVEAIGAQVR